MTGIDEMFDASGVVIVCALALQAWTMVREVRVLGDKMSLALFVAALGLAARGVAAILGLMPADIMGEVVILAVSGALVAASYMNRTSGIDKDLYGRLTLERSPNPIMIKRASGEYEYINPAFETAFGVTFADVLGRTAEEIWDENLSLAAMEADRRVTETGIPSTHKVVFTLSGHHPQDWLVSKFAIPLPDGGISIATFYSEVSDHAALERRLAESEARIQTLLDNSPAPIYFKDRDFRFVMVNRRFTEVYGASAEDVIGKTSLDVHGNDKGAMFIEHDREVMEKRTLIRREEIIGGATFLTAKFPVINSDGELIGVGGIETDISERVAVERAYREARDQAEAANRSKSAFLANMSHELRTPLNSIIGFSDSLLAGTLGPVENPKHREYLSIIRDGGEHLLQLINDILDLSRIEAGKLKLDESAVDLHTVFADSVRLVAERAGSAGLYIDNRIPKDLPALWADERQLRQVLINLMSNAIKFTDAGGRIDATARITEDGGAEIRVADTGTGIDAENLKLVLQPFVQVADAMTRRHKGSGLGLAIVQSIVNMHGGTFTLESSPGKGTTAIIRMPRARVMTPDKDAE